LDTAQELELLIRSKYPIIYLETWEEERAEKLLKIIAQKLGKYLFIWTSTKGLFRSDIQEPIYNTNHPLNVLSHIYSADIAALYLLKDFHQHLDDPVVIRKLKDISGLFEKNDGCIIISTPEVKIPTELTRTMVHLELMLASRDELKEVIVEAIKELRNEANIYIGLSLDGLNQMAERLKGLTLSEAKRTIYQAILQDNRLTMEDLHRVVEAKKEIIEKSSILEIYYCQDSLSLVGGMDTLKSWLSKRKKALSEKAKKFGLEPPKGILIIGVQGCGKSLMAKAVARDWNLPLLKLDAGKIYDKYIGESEKNLRQALSITESMAPVVLWVDEIEKGFSYSQFSEADSGLSKRVFATFLTWLKEKKRMVFVVATSNDIFSLPPELIRKRKI